MVRRAALDSADPEMAVKAMVSLYQLGIGEFEWTNNDGEQVRCEPDVKALCEWLNRIGVRGDRADVEDVVEEAARKIIEVVWGPDAATLQQDRGIGSSKN